MKKLITLFTAVALMQGCKKKEETPPAPLVDFTVTNAFRTHPDTVSFAAVSNIAGTTYEWDFADGSAKENGDSITHLFDYGYYYVTLRGTSNGQTSPTTHGVNSSPYSKVIINQIVVSKIPAANSSGGTWDSDGSGPDVYCKITIPSNSSTTIVTNDAATGNVFLYYSVIPGLVDNLLDNNITVDVFDYDAGSLSDELMESITIPKAFIPLMTKNTPYAATLTFSGINVTATISFTWLN